MEKRHRRGMIERDWRRQIGQGGRGGFGCGEKGLRTLVESRRYRRAGASGRRTERTDSTVALVLPVIRMERAPDHPGSEPDAAIGEVLKRSRRGPRGCGGRLARAIAA